MANDHLELMEPGTAGPVLDVSAERVRQLAREGKLETIRTAGGRYLFRTTVTLSGSPERGGRSEKSMTTQRKTVVPFPALEMTITRRTPLLELPELLYRNELMTFLGIGRDAAYD